MGRKSLAEERTEQILEAFGKCVARFGLEGSSLEKIAETAGMKRSILRHYIGNREDLIHALAEKVIKQYHIDFVDVLKEANPKNPATWLSRFLFPENYNSTTEELLVIEALIGAADQYPKIRKRVADYMDDVVQALCELLQRSYANVGKRKSWNVAYGIICIVFNHDSLSPLQLSADYLKAAKQSMLVLLDSLQAD